MREQFSTGKINYNYHCQKPLGPPLAATKVKNHHDDAILTGIFAYNLQLSTLIWSEIAESLMTAFSSMNIGTLMEINNKKIKKKVWTIW